MRFWLSIFGFAAVPLFMGVALSAQSIQDQQNALRAAKDKAAQAQQRSEELRQEASNAGRASDKIMAQSAVLSAEIDVAAAQIEAAKARIALINSRQKAQRSQLGEANEPMLRLNSALQQMTNRPTTLMILQPGQRKDYIHLRAVMATVEPRIRQRTAALRQQISIQKELRSQELLALKSIQDARSQLAARRTALAKLEGSNRNRANSLSNDAAIEFEQAIAQGERARDIVEQIDTNRMSGEMETSLAALDGPVLRQGAGANGVSKSGAYILPEYLKLITGFNELTETGYRERGILLSVEPSADVSAPAAGKVVFAGNYRSYGKVVIIEHGSGWTTLITGMDALSVDNGDAVKQGTIVGNASANTPQIGIELRRRGRTIDIVSML
jgi:murein hydrolase activator